MLEKSFSLLYFLKNAGNESKKFIYLRITVDGIRTEVSIKKKWWENRWMNEAAIRIYGYRREQFLAMRTLDIRPKDDQNMLINLIKDRKENNFFPEPIRHILPTIISLNN